MDLHRSVPSSATGEGGYEPAEHPLPVTAPLSVPAPAPAPGGGGNGLKVPAPPPSSRTAVLQAPAAAAVPTEPAAAVAPPTIEAKAPGATVKASFSRELWARRRFDLPAWSVSLVVHVVILSVLGAATFSTEVRPMVANIDSALGAPPGSADELVKIYADPSDLPRDQAVGDVNATAPGPSAGFGGGIGGAIGTGGPSATPRVTGVGGGIGEPTGLAALKVVPQLSGLSLLPTAPGKDLGGGGLISGDVTYETTDVGVALDQLAREILRHLSQHKLTVVWLFDESESMKDDQRAVKEKFDRVASELKLNTGSDKKAAGALNHAIVGFGQGIHYELEKPTFDIDQIGRAIDRLRVDDSGVENTMHAIQEVVAHYSGLIRKDRRLLIVLITDESGDDGDYVEEARQAVVGRGVPLYVIGRQSLFGYDRAHLIYVDPVTKDVYYPAIHRGPETAFIETLQWDGLHERWDEQPSGFAPYELARLARDSGGIYFLLPSEENMRVRQREKAYSITTLKEYLPDYESRLTYVKRRYESEFRRTLFQIITETRTFALPTHFSVDPAAMIQEANAAGVVATNQLNVLLAIQKRLEQLERHRNRETDKRWQAHYDLILAQIVAYQVKTYEYRACLAEMLAKPPVPSKMPTPALAVQWVMNHSPSRKAPREQTAKKYAEAERLLKQVVDRHPRTPWADLAQDNLNRGLGIQRDEWQHSPSYNDRWRFVPKY
jgi:hypothetical protein